MKPFPLVIISLAVLLLSCEKAIDIPLDNTAPKLVVEATIENGEPPVVILSRSVGFFSQITPQLLTGSFVRGADVLVGNGRTTHRLKEYSRSLGPGLEFRYYSIDSANLATAFAGELNGRYTLRITVEGQIYEAVTTIPAITKRLDSMWWKPAPVTDPSKAIIMVRATDPPGFGDYVRIFTRVNGQPFLPPLNSAFDDFFIDGTTYDLQLFPGIDRNRMDLVERVYFQRGDTVTLKVSNIDQQTFDFWRTMEFSYASIGNPFSTPTAIRSNLSGGALGYFGGYASQTRTLVIPR
jgi:hypothetical protein